MNCLGKLNNIFLTNVSCNVYNRLKRFLFIILFFIPVLSFSQQHYFEVTKNYSLNNFGLELMRNNIAPDEYFETQNCIDSLLSSDQNTRGFYFFVCRSVSPRINNPLIKKHLGETFWKYLHAFPSECLINYSRLTTFEKYYFDQFFVMSQRNKFNKKIEIELIFKSICTTCALDEVTQLNHLKEILINSIEKQ